MGSLGLRGRVVEFDDLARALVQNSGRLDPDSSEQLRGALSAFVRQRFGAALDDDARHDVVSDALDGFSDAARRGVVHADGAPAYLLTTVRSRAVDVLRRRRYEPAPVAEVPVTGATASDEAASVIERESAKATVKAAVRELVKRGEWGDVAVVTAWLDLASQSGGVPSSRSVGELAGVSHVQVQRVLGRLRALVAELDDDPPEPPTPDVPRPAPRS